MADSATKPAAAASAPTGSGPVRQHPVANAGIGMLGAGLGTAAAVGVGPIVIPALVVGGLAGYFLTNQTPAK
jgi:hypothetical protein